MVQCIGTLNIGVRRLGNSKFLKIEQKPQFAQIDYYTYKKLRYSEKTTIIRINKYTI